MKKLLFALAFVASCAQAETITLAPSSCGTVKNCPSVANDTGAAVAIYSYYVLPGVHVYIDGMEYDAPSGNSMTIQGLVLTNTLGEAITLDATFSGNRVCVRSGRGQSCHTNYFLVSGSIVR